MKRINNMVKLMALFFVVVLLASAKSPEPIDNKNVDDDLRCVIRNKEGVKLGACWFCDCAELAKQIVP